MKVVSAECSIHGCDLKHDSSCAECDLEALASRLLAGGDQLAQTVARFHQCEEPDCVGKTVAANWAALVEEAKAAGL